MTRLAPLALVLALALAARGQDPQPDGDSDVPTLAANKALAWLKTEQKADGSWPAPSGEPVVGDTSLVVLAYLGQGHTHRFGVYKRVVSQGLGFIKRMQASDGGIGYEPKQPKTLLEHTLATMALAEAYAVSRDFTLKRYVERARDFLLAQGDPKAGWARAADGKPDTLLTAWVALALKALKTAGIEVPPAAFERVKAHFDAVTDARHRVGGFSGGKAETGEAPLGNAMAYIARIFAGQRRSELASLLQPLVASPPTWGEGKAPYEYWYFATYSAFQAGGTSWKTWLEGLEPALVGHQQEDGSWPTPGPGRPIRATALATLAVEVWARYQRAQSR